MAFRSDTNYVHAGKDNADIFSITLLLSGMIVILLILKFFLIFSININWDEFAYLGRIYKYSTGELHSPLQSFTVIFFPWVIHINGTEVDQIKAARLLVFTFHVGSVAILTRIAYKFTGMNGALFTTLCYLCFSYTIAHSTSLRHDTIAIFFCLAAIAVIITRTTSWMYIIISGAIFSVALAITPKSIIFSVLLFAIFLTDKNNNHQPLYKLRFLVTFFIVSAGIFILLISLYSNLLNESNQIFIKKISESSSIFIQTDNIDTRIYYFFKTLRNDLLIWVLVIVGFFYGVMKVFSSSATSEKIYGTGLIILTLPLAGIFFYRNMFPYYYIMFMPIILILSGISYRWLQYELPSTRSIIILILLPILIFISGISHSIARLKYENNSQDILLENIHAMFRAPVNYIDRCSMVSSFPMVGFFMTTAGMELYNRNNEAIFEKILNNSQPKFILANNMPLQFVFTDNSNKLPPSRRLIKDDEEILRSNYIHHWEYIYIAGKHIYLDGKNEQLFRIFVSGTYTVETEYPVLIDKTLYQPNDVVTLLQGEHIILGSQVNQDIVLRWGKNIFRPVDKLDNKLFVDF